jgi:hypothetical protein
MTSVGVGGGKPETDDDADENTEQTWFGRRLDKKSSVAQMAGLLISLGLSIGVVLLTGAFYLRRNRTAKKEII